MIYHILATNVTPFSSGLPERRAKGSSALVGAVLPLNSLREGCQAQQTVTSRLVEAGTMMETTPPSLNVYLYI